MHGTHNVKLRRCIIWLADGLCSVWFILSDWYKNTANVLFGMMVFGTLNWKPSRNKWWRIRRGWMLVLQVGNKVSGYTSAPIFMVNIAVSFLSWRAQQVSRNSLSPCDNYYTVKLISNGTIIAWHCRDRVSSFNIYVVQQDTQCGLNE